jgi:hypothetical protein
MWSQTIFNLFAIPEASIDLIFIAPAFFSIKIVTSFRIQFSFVLYPVLKKKKKVQLTCAAKKLRIPDPVIRSCP